MCLCVFRCATLPPAIHRPEGIILFGLLRVRPGHQPDWPLPECHRHAHPMHRVRRHVQHSLYNPVQPDSRISVRRRGTGLCAEESFTAVILLISLISFNTCTQPETVCKDIFFFFCFYMLKRFNFSPTLSHSALGSTHFCVFGFQFKAYFNKTDILEYISLFQAYY